MIETNTTFLCNSLHRNEDKEEETEQAAARRDDSQQIQ
jgi:hypothetical protein